MIFANSACLLLILLVIPLTVWYILRGRKRKATLSMPATAAYAKMPASWKSYLVHVPFILEMLAIVLLSIILARPQTTDRWENTEVEGIDIMMCMDVSTSMLAEDLKPNRLEAAKSVAAEFINGRPNDNIGLSIFAGEAFTQCPMTVDHAVLINMFQSVSSDIAAKGIIDDGTAIGMGLANAISRLKDSQAKSKVIILLTDGSNNRGEISPLTAAEMARSFGIRVYTIGVGTNGTAPYPVQTNFGIQYMNMMVEIDEEMLRQIAQTAGGQYYRATSNSKLKEVYEQIDQMERTKLQVKEFSRNEEEYQPFALVLLLVLLLAVLLKQTILRTIP
ncbi:MAG: VWA domain-containing protein [Bacteroidaceae bacterium]|nr:VWA domain-containing protein [Bacteroidaceae bacterium]